MENIANLLNVTEQQFEILRAIDAIKNKARPKDIDRAYKNLTGKYIQKPNLFAQLRELQKQDFILKSEGAYQVNKTKLKQSLQKRKQELKKSIGKCDALAKKVDQIFVSKPTEVRIKYLSRKGLLKLNVDTLKEATLFLRTAHLPAVTYSELSQRINDVKEYSDVLKERCKKRKLKVQYIISLKPKRIFLRALEKLKDKNLAYKEVEVCYKNLIDLLKIPNLEFYYLSADIESFGVAESDVFSILTLPLRASPHRIIGAIAIENKKISDAYKEMFNRLYKTAKPLTKYLIKKVAQQKLKELKDSINKL